MNSFLYFIFFGIAVAIGFLIGLFTIGQIILITGLGIPLAVRLKNNGLFASYTPVIRYITTLIFLFIVLTIAIVLMVVFFPQFLLAFLFGAGIAFHQSSTAARNLTGDSMSDFLSFNERHFTVSPKDLDENDFLYYFNLSDTASMRSNEIFAKFFGDAISNIPFYGIFTALHQKSL